MALSGTINGKVTNRSDLFSFYIEWSATQSVSENCSYVTVTTYWSTNNTAYDFDTVGDRSASITIDGSTKSITKRFDLTLWPSNPYAIQTVSKHKVQHNNDGTKKIKISATANGYAATYGPSSSLSDPCTASDEVTLDTIPRAATVSSVTDFTNTTSPSITFSNPAGFKLCPYINFYNSNDPNGAGTRLYQILRSKGSYSSSYNFSLTTTEQDNILKALTDNKEYVVYIGLLAYDNQGNYIGYDSKQAKYTINDYSDKFITNEKIEDVNLITQTLTGDSLNKFIKGYSMAKVSMELNPQSYADITSSSISCGNKSIQSGQTFNPVDSATFIFKAKDSRKFVQTKTVQKTLINYINPTCSISVSVPNTQGECLMSVSGDYWNGNFGAKHNTFQLEYCYKEKGSTSSDNWITVIDESTITKSNNKYSTSIAIVVPNYKKEYVFKARISDELHGSDRLHDSIQSESIEKTSNPVFDWGKNDFNFNVPLYYQGNPMDFVVEYGEEDGVIWKKWNSGISECWVKKRYESIDVTSSSNGSYYGDVDDFVNFPNELFVESPTVIPSIMGNGILFVMVKAISTNNAQLRVCSSNSTTTGVEYLSCIAKGKWK